VKRDQSLIERLSRERDIAGGWAAGVEIVPFGARVLLEVPVKRWLLAGVAQ